MEQSIASFSNPPTIVRLMHYLSKSLHKSQTKVETPQQNAPFELPVSASTCSYSCVDLCPLRRVTISYAQTQARRHAACSRVCEFAPGGCPSSYSKVNVQSRCPLFTHSISLLFARVRHLLNRDRIHPENGCKIQRTHPGG